jgi:hypothetical protein
LISKPDVRTIPHEIAQLSAKSRSNLRCLQPRKEMSDKKMLDKRLYMSEIYQTGVKCHQLSCKTEVASASRRIIANQNNYIRHRKGI